MSDVIEIGPYAAGEVPEPLVISFRNALGGTYALDGEVEAWVVLSANLDAPVVRPAEWNAEDGTVTFTWEDGDLASPGVIELEAWISNGTNRPRSQRCVGRVRSSLSTERPE